MRFEDLQDDVVMLKLIKEYILQHPYSTARDISSHFATHSFGIKTDYTAREISRLITSNSSNWFNVKVISKTGKAKQYVVE